MSNEWLVFPALQSLLSVIAGILIAVYGGKVAGYLGGGVIQRVMLLITIMAFLLAIYTVLVTAGYVIDSIVLRETGRTLLLVIGAAEIYMALIIRKMAIEFKRMENGE